ncbi:MAG: protein kinase [Vicinamibacteria bacterium]|nr:protein kinase [Vicinamibacteria bacterium]
MSAGTVCPRCGFAAKVPEAARGKMLRCPRCQERFICGPAPGASVAEPPEAPAPQATQWDDAGAARSSVMAARPPAAPAPQATQWDASSESRASATVTTPRASPAAPAPTAFDASVRSARPTLPESSLRPAPTAASLAAWNVGDVVLDLYEIVSLLGQGGMGRVYRARHRGWGIDLAIKTPLAEVLQAVGGAENFEREAETWVNLGLHPHIVSCYYIRRVDGLPRVFAELVDGGSLHDWIKQRRLQRIDQMLDVAIQFAWGLHYAHEQGLVHQDVKPANVLLTADGVLKVTDFGLARAKIGPAGLGTQAGGTVSVPGAGAGTLGYMAPEQGGRAPLTRRTDLWGWAVSVLEMFIGRRTWEFGLAAPEVLADFLARGGKSVGLPAMPKGLADLLQRCFAVDPDRRPHTMWDAAAALYAIYEEAAAVPYPRPEPTAGRDTADSLSNRAVSMLDLGRAGEAETLWQRALATQPHHLEATYNSAVHHWTGGRIGDDELLNRIQEALKTETPSARTQHLLGRLHLYLGQTERAVRLLRANSSRMSCTTRPNSRAISPRMPSRSAGRARRKRRKRYSAMRPPSGANCLPRSTRPRPICSSVTSSR